jgi:Na+/H+ antiporter NhaA
LRRYSKVTNMGVYGALGAALWFCLLKGGINADIAGVIAAFAIPVGRCCLKPVFASTD